MKPRKSKWILFLDSLWRSWHPFFFMVQCMTLMTSYTTINDSLWVQCFLWRSTRILLTYKWMADLHIFDPSYMGVLSDWCVAVPQVVSNSVLTQWLASWFCSEEISWIFDISCQHLGDYSCQGLQDFARFFKTVERNPTQFLDFLARKPRISKILARETRKSCSKVIQDLQICCKQLSLKTQKVATLVCVFI